jgi:hypothetical protein
MKDEVEEKLTEVNVTLSRLRGMYHQACQDMCYQHDKRFHAQAVIVKLREYIHIQQVEAERLRIIEKKWAGEKP